MLTLYSNVTMLASLVVIRSLTWVHMKRDNPSSSHDMDCETNVGCMLIVFPVLWVG